MFAYPASFQHSQPFGSGFQPPPPPPHHFYPPQGAPFGGPNFTCFPQATPFGLDGMTPPPPPPGPGFAYGFHGYGVPFHYPGAHFGMHRGQWSGFPGAFPPRFHHHHHARGGPDFMRPYPPAPESPPFMAEHTPGRQEPARPGRDDEPSSPPVGEPHDESPPHGGLPPREGPHAHRRHGRHGRHGHGEEVRSSGHHVDSDGQMMHPPSPPPPPPGDDTREEEGTRRGPPRPHHHRGGRHMHGPPSWPPFHDSHGFDCNAPPPLLDHTSCQCSSCQAYWCPHCDQQADCEGPFSASPANAPAGGPLNVDCPWAHMDPYGRHWPGPPSSPPMHHHPYDYYLHGSRRGRGGFRGGPFRGGPFRGGFRGSFRGGDFRGGSRGGGLRGGFRGRGLRGDGRGCEWCEWREPTSEPDSDSEDEDQRDNLVEGEHPTENVARNGQSEDQVEKRDEDWEGVESAEHGPNTVTLAEEKEVGEGKVVE